MHAMGRSTVQEDLPKCINGFIDSEVNSELVQANGLILEINKN